MLVTSSPSGEQSKEKKSKIPPLCERFIEALADQYDLYGVGERREERRAKSREEERREEAKKRREAIEEKQKRREEKRSRSDYCINLLTFSLSWYVQDSHIQKDLLQLEVDDPAKTFCFDIGVMFARKGQTTEREFFDNGKEREKRLLILT